MAMRSASSHFDARAAFVSLAAHGFAVGAIAVATAGLGPAPPTVEPARATYMVVEVPLVALPEKDAALPDLAEAEPPPPLPPAQVEIRQPREPVAQSAIAKSATPKAPTPKVATPKAPTQKTLPVLSDAPHATTQPSSDLRVESQTVTSGADAAIPDISPDVPATATQSSTSARAAEPMRTDSTAGPMAGPAAAEVAAAHAPVVHAARFRAPPAPPIYPRRAIELDLRGTTILRALVDADGAAAEIVVWATSGLRLLDDAAIAAARGWKFEPAREGAVAVAAWVEVPVRFELR
ncbi:MAG: TonB family protein [Rhodospirillales bacterium]|jgi:protein TonB